MGTARRVSFDHGAADIPTYYDLPSLKQSFYGWKVSDLHSGSPGSPGSSQILAAIGRVYRRASLCRASSATDAMSRSAGSVVGCGAADHRPAHADAVLQHAAHLPPDLADVDRQLCADQFRRAERRSGRGAAAARSRRRAERARHGSRRAAQIPAAVTGAAMSTYTGALLAATSTPLWAALPKLLPAAFGASAMASAAAALSLLAAGVRARDAAPRRAGREHGRTGRLWQCCPASSATRALRRGSASRRCSALAAAPLLHQIAGAIERPRADRADETAAQNRRAARFGKASAVAVLAGAFLLRHLVLRAGNESAKRPRDHFRFSRPR